MNTLKLKGAKANNLKNLDLDLKHGQWIAVTGPSGSGKSTLVFDCLVKEGQRRFLGSLSPRARHFLSKLGRSAIRDLRGVPAPIAVGQQSTTAHARSTVGTLSGTLDLLRLLFARAAKHPKQQILSRSHFSFNHPLGACEACNGLGVEDQVTPSLLIANAQASIRGGALVPTLKNGYTVYSQVTLEVMEQICQAHGFSVDIPWSQLTQAQQQVIFYGTQALKVPFGKHSLASRMKWEGITARPRVEGYYRGLIPVIEETLKRSRNPNILRFVTSIPCSECQGTRLNPIGKTSRLGSFTLPHLLGLDCRQLINTLSTLNTHSAVTQAIIPGLQRRLDSMISLGLGHLSLARESKSLSGGEAQRLRLSTQLLSGLSRQLIALDEPTLGLHPSGQKGMAKVLRGLVGLGNTILAVEHDPDMVRHGDHWLSLGPGAGQQGGELLHQGPLFQDPLGPPPKPKTPRASRGEIILRGASLNNLQHADLSIHLGTLNVVLGPSGAGKSSLVFGTLLPALLGKPGGEFLSLEGHSKGIEVHAVDASPIGRTPRSTPATWTGLFDHIRRRFAATPEAKAQGLTASHFSYNNKKGQCPACEGLGVQRLGLHLLEDAEQRCPTCQGTRYSPKLVDFHFNHKNIAQVLAMSVKEAYLLFAEDPPIAKLLRAMDDLGLAYLSLGQSSTTLSRGEAQRIKLATLIGRQSKKSTIFLMDEPDRGLHPSDVQRLLKALDRLIENGHSILAISHHRHLWAAADRLTELRSGKTFANPKLNWTRLSEVYPEEKCSAGPTHIKLQGVKTHNLKDLDLEIPHGKLTIICGPSGSGKSALAFATLAAEAQGRYAETLPFQVRRHLRRMPKAKLEAAQGLSPTLSMPQRHGKKGLNRRSTVATQSQMATLLRILWSRCGLLNGKLTQLSAEHFSTNSHLGACEHCSGVGSQDRCTPESLINDESKALFDGAMGKTKAGRYFGEADGQYKARLQAALPHANLALPWSQLSTEVQQTALYGSGPQLFKVTWHYQRGKRSGSHDFTGPWEGLCTLVELEAKKRAKQKSAALWREALSTGPCLECEGTGLKKAARNVEIQGLKLPELMAMTIHQVQEVIKTLSAPSRLQQEALDALRPRLLNILEDLTALGISHLHLKRSCVSLSDGELQRVHLGGILRSGLTGTTIILDEPGAGLHAQDLGPLLQRLKSLTEDGNTVIAVSHRPAVIQQADWLIELGPKSGEEGGWLVAQGTPPQVLSGQTLTALALAKKHLASKCKVAPSQILIQGAKANNLQGFDLSLPKSGFVTISGVSGSGKSSLLFDVLAASALSGKSKGCTNITGLKHYKSVRSTEQVTIGQTPLDILGLLKPLQALYHKQDPNSPLTASAFSFRSASGWCPTCKGTGVEKISLDILADLKLPCPSCNGDRYRPEVLAIKHQGLNIANILQSPVDCIASLFSVGPIAKGIRAMQTLGLGHLQLGRSRSELSGGELQRLILAASLLSPKDSPSLLLLDEPAKGLHESDLANLLSTLQKLAKRGDLIVAAAHRLSLICSADWVIELGPSAGHKGGFLVSQGSPDTLSNTSTAQALESFIQGNQQP